MSFQSEVLTDRTETRQESLRALRVAKASHTPLALQRGLMAVLCTMLREHPAQRDRAIRKYSVVITQIIYSDLDDA
jgi:hypothetical protein